MNRLDWLIIKAMPKETVTERLGRDNPYLQKQFEDLLDYMGEDYRAPEMGTPEWDKFIYAFICLYECTKSEIRVTEPQTEKEDEVKQKGEYEVNGIDCMEAYKRLFRGDINGTNQIKDQDANGD